MSIKLVTTVPVGSTLLPKIFWNFVISSSVPKSGKTLLNLFSIRAFKLSVNKSLLSLFNTFWAVSTSPALICFIVLFTNVGKSNWLWAFLSFFTISIERSSSLSNVCSAWISPTNCSSPLSVRIGLIPRDIFFCLLVNTFSWYASCWALYTLESIKLLTKFCFCSSVKASSFGLSLFSAMTWSNDLSFVNSSLVFSFSSSEILKVNPWSSFNFANVSWNCLLNWTNSGSLAISVKVDCACAFTPLYILKEALPHFSSFALVSAYNLSTCSLSLSDKSL